MSRSAEAAALVRWIETTTAGDRRLFVDPYAAAFLGSGARALARLAGWPLVGAAAGNEYERTVVARLAGSGAT